MRILILGGTVFLGRHVAAEALARGHAVTLFHRGRHGVNLFPEAERVLGDRGGDLGGLRGRRWDAIVDTSGYEPEHVAESAALDAGHYVFVSSLNAYADWPARPVREDSPAWQELRGEYGPKKAAAERAAEAAMPGRVAVVRAGLLVGPHDNIFRLPWWVRRLTRGGTVPAPGDPERRLQLIDARDLATWMLDLAERRVGGVFNGTGPPGQTTIAQVLETAAAATRGGARLRWVPDHVLKACGVEEWVELPLWSTAAGTWEAGTRRAQAAGLSPRPVGDTVRDVAAWLRAGGARALEDFGATHRPAEMSAQREAELLAAADEAASV